MSRAVLPGAPKVPHTSATGGDGDRIITNRIRTHQYGAIAPADNPYEAVASVSSVSSPPPPPDNPQAAIPRSCHGHRRCHAAERGSTSRRCDGVSAIANRPYLVG